MDKAASQFDYQEAGKGHEDTVYYDDLASQRLQENKKVTEIKFYWSEYLMGAEVFYDNKPGVPQISKNGYLHSGSIVVQEGEHIVEIKGRAGALVDFVTVQTSLGREKDFGESKGGQPFKLRGKPGEVLRGLKLGTGGHLHIIGAYFGPQIENKQLFYKEGGNHHKDTKMIETLQHKDKRITEVKLFSERLVYGLEIYADHHSIGLYQGLEKGPKMTTETLQLEPGENITEIQGRYKDVITKLTFITSRGRQITVGKKKGKFDISLKGPPGTVVRAFKFGIGGHLHFIGAYFDFPVDDTKKPTVVEKIENFAADALHQLAEIEAKKQEEKREEERREAERIEAERIDAEKREEVRREIERLALEKLEAEREHLRKAAEHKELERLEAERLEFERKETERWEAQRLELERREIERLEAEKREEEMREADRRELERIEADRRENERREAERIENERREEEERREVERREAFRIEALRIAEEGRREIERIVSEKRRIDEEARIQEQLRIQAEEEFRRLAEEKRKEEEFKQQQEEEQIKARTENISPDNSPKKSNEEKKEPKFNPKIAPLPTPTIDIPIDELDQFIFKTGRAGTSDAGDTTFDHFTTIFKKFGFRKLLEFHVYHNMSKILGIEIVYDYPANLTISRKVVDHKRSDIQKESLILGRDEKVVSIKVAFGAELTGITITSSKGRVLQSGDMNAPETREWSKEGHYLCCFGGSFGQIKNKNEKALKGLYAYYTNL